MEYVKKNDWDSLQSGLSQKGYALMENVLTHDACKSLIKDFGVDHLYRKTVEMERYRFGLGTYRYYTYPLPEVIAAIREQVYLKLVPIANQWMQQLKMGISYPEELVELRQVCMEKGQNLATPLILSYGKGGHNTLHQDLYGEVYFPMQAVLFLNEYGKDYQGGEFVLTQQVPRAQSKPIVLQPKQGSMLVFPTNYRPILGKRGHYRASMRHGVSEVHSGERYTLGVIFHDAAQ